MIDVYFWPTPNGKKVTILLEEAGLEYKLVPVQLNRGDQFKDQFLKISPNNRMPAIVDHAPPGGGAPVEIFESGAIMMYLAEKAGKFWPQEIHKKYAVAQWVMWQMANQGPKLGEAGHFGRLGPEQGDQTYALTRFRDEANRLYGVMNYQLFKHPYMAGDEYTIADMICYPWTVNMKAQGQELEEFPHFKRWFEEIGQRPAVMLGMAATVKADELSAEQQANVRKIMYNQRARPIPA